MRLVFSFLLASALFGAGLYLLFLEVFVARIIMGRMLAIGGLLLAAGGAWLWADFVGPLIRGEKMG